MAHSERRLVVRQTRRYVNGTGNLVWRLATAGVLMLGAAMSSAQTFPIRPVRIVVPYPPGGPKTLLRELPYSDYRRYGSKPRL